MTFIGHAGGATAIEYAIIAAGIAVVIAGAVAALGTRVAGMFSLVKF